MNEDQAKPKRIAIQGGYGAFHEIAALNYFENEEIEIIPRTTFKDLFQALKHGQVDYGITAIENSIAGSILPNYSLLQESNLRIIGEIYLRIKQNPSHCRASAWRISTKCTPIRWRFCSACAFLMTIRRSCWWIVWILPFVQRKLPKRRSPEGRPYQVKRQQNSIIWI